ncbi:MAG TPA: enolase C-terminal domain-like protein [Opitutaceae bacterium]|nr:enolase C-terminal domain-like protein [Opitutaceae bacterium]
MATGSVETVQSLRAAAYAIPTDRPESDGTLEWSHTGVVVVTLEGGGASGLGWTYGSGAVAGLVDSVLKPVVVGQPVLARGELWNRMSAALRNAGLPGAGAMALSAVDIALWDLQARMLQLPLVDLLGPARPAVELYGSGGFTSYTEAELTEQLSGWARMGLRSVKMKVGRHPDADRHRVLAARRAIGPATALMVDGNGAYERKQALRLAEAFAQDAGVCWFEEPVSSEDLGGLRLLRDRGPAGMDIAAGEYGHSPAYFRAMLEAGAVDCLQADATRCGGFTGFLKAAGLAEAWGIPFSAHCAPQLHAQAGCAAPKLRHVEYFHDHVRADRLLFAGVLEPREGRLAPDRARPGHGLALKEADAARYRL